MKIYEPEIRIRAQCTKDEDHAKILRFKASVGREYVETLAGLLDGSSPFYIFPPGDLSPIGKCGICGAPIKCSVFELRREGGQGGDISESLRQSITAEVQQSPADGGSDRGATD